MKSLKQVAEIILGRRNTLSVGVQDHHLKAELGHEGLNEALRRHWLEADEETGHLAMSRQASRIKEMRECAASTEAAAPPATAVNFGYGREFTTLHQGRIEEQATDHSRPVLEADEDAEVGDEVVVAADGKSYQATVQSRKPDGKLVLSFGAAKPSTTKEYGKGEFKVTKKSGAKPGQPSQPSQPAKPAGTTVSAGGPSAPGLGSR